MIRPEAPEENIAAEPEPEAPKEEEGVVEKIKDTAEDVAEALHLKKKEGEEEEKEKKEEKLSEEPVTEEEKVE